VGVTIGKSMAVLGRMFVLGREFVLGWGFVLGRMPVFDVSGTVREEVIETSTRGGVGEVEFGCAPIGADMRTSTRDGVGEVEFGCTPIGADVWTSTHVRVGEVEGFTPEDVFFEICDVTLAPCRAVGADKVDEVVGGVPEAPCREAFCCLRPDGTKLWALGLRFEGLIVTVGLGGANKDAPERSQSLSLGKGQGFVGQFLHG